MITLPRNESMSFNHKKMVGIKRLCIIEWNGVIEMIPDS